MNALTEPAAVRTAAPVATRVAQAGVALFVLLVALLHGLRTDYSPVDDPISAYAVGRDGWLMTVAFLANAVAFLALAVGIRRSAGGLVSVLLAVAGLGMAVASIAHTDMPVVTPPSPVGAVHAASALISFLCLTVAGLVSLRRLRSAAASAVAVAAVPAFLVFLGLTFTESAGAGLAQRILTGLLLAWVLIAAQRTRIER